MDPQGPSQPSLNQVYETPGNPADQEPAEKTAASQSANTNSGSIVDQRERGDVPVPSQHDGNATASSLGYGARDSSGDKGESLGPGASNVEGEQMRAAGDGDIYRAQFNKHGFGEQESLTAGLDDKKQEQEGLRQEKKEQRKNDVDVGGALGQRGGAAVVEGR
ncbi:hypothetical protein MMC25_000387 [Agyrium rufum]|nr:hypothetical protein [Agyrium rufum]